MTFPIVPALLSAVLLAYGAALVMAGVTTTEELLRVTAEG